MEDNTLQLNNPQSLSIQMDFEGDKNLKSENEQVNKNSISNEQHITDNLQEENEEESDQLLEQSVIKKSPSKRWEKNRRDREEKYLLSQALAEEKRRNLELQKYLSRSIDNNTIGATERALADLEMAEHAHAQALESNDALAAAKASTALIQANLAVEKLANTKMYSNEEDNNYHINPNKYASDKILNDWLIDNPEFDENSNHFNRELVVKTAPLINKLDAKLKQRGQSDLISTPIYFDIIDSLVSQMKEGRRYERPLTAPVSSRNYNSQNNYKPRTVLTQQQKIVAAGCNMSEEQYANWLRKYEKEKYVENMRDSYGY